MLQKNKALHFSLGTFLVSGVFSFLLMGTLWVLCVGLQKLGCPFPAIKGNQFSDLGFFALSNFSFITFLAMIPFQTTEGQLSPGFYFRIVNRPWSHFGLHILLCCFFLCFFILGYQEHFSDMFLSQIYMTVVASVIVAVIFHRNQVLRYLYQPKIVYESLAKLATEEGSEDLWLDLYECTFKAIKANRINNARNFILLMSKLYTKMSDTGILNPNLKKDVQSLYEAAKDQPPVALLIERNWSFVCTDAKTHEPGSLVDTLARLIK